MFTLIVWLILITINCFAYLYIRDTQKTVERYRAHIKSCDAIIEEMAAENYVERKKYRDLEVEAGKYKAQVRAMSER